MKKQEFKTTFIKNLRFYLPDEFKDVRIMMRLAKKKEKLFIETEINSVRQVNHAGFKWRVDFRKEVTGCDLSQIMLLAHYKTADVSWDYEGKGE